MYISHILWKVGDRTGCLPQLPRSPSYPKVPSSLTRRLTNLGKEALAMLYKSQVQNIPWVASCRHGDAERMLRLFGNIAQNDPLSPTDFGMSVHNAIISSFSLATQNKKAHTAMAACEQSFQMGMLEAIALCKNMQESVGYIYYDSPLPQIYDDKVESNVAEQYFLIVFSPVHKKGVEFILDLDISVECNELVPSFQIAKYLEGHDTSFTIPYPGGQISLRRPT